MKPFDFQFQLFEISKNKKNPKILIKNICSTTGGFLSIHLLEKNWVTHPFF